MALLDQHARPLRNLRVSVTDRCNLRCAYCMPEEEYTWLPRRDLLTFEEIARLVEAFTSLGVRRLRLTGGEPLLRRELEHLVALFSANEALEDLALTTNGLLLADQAEALHAAGLHRVTVSLDSLRPERFRDLSRRDGLADVLSGIEAARAAGFQGTKIDTVVMRGTNDDELVDLVEYGKRVDAEVRFIEYMDVGGATRWTPEVVVSRREMLARLAAHYGELTPVGKTDSAPADRYRLPDGTVFGIISSTTEPFCGSCDRSRLTADGTWYLCLYAQKGVDLRKPLRDGASAEELAELLRSGWGGRTERGAEERLSAEQRGALLGKEALASDPRLEMHTRGG
jgi:cyclic pyranopterin phosphate synthase